MWRQPPHVASQPSLKSKTSLASFPGNVDVRPEVRGRTQRQALSSSRWPSSDWPIASANASRYASERSSSTNASQAGDRDPGSAGPSAPRGTTQRSRNDIAFSPSWWFRRQKPVVGKVSRSSAAAAGASAPAR